MDGKRPQPIDNIRWYQSTAFMNPSNAGARINSAAVRLIVADDGDNHIQSVVLLPPSLR